MEISLTAPQTAEILLAKQQPTKVQLNCPDFYNGIKTVGAHHRHLILAGVELPGLL